MEWWHCSHPKFRSLRTDQCDPDPSTSSPALNTSAPCGQESSTCLCGVGMLLGYCCNERGELPSCSAGPAPPHHTALVCSCCTNTSPQSRACSVLPVPLPSADPCPELHLKAVGGRCNSSEHSLYQRISTTCGQSAAQVFDSRGELEGILLFPSPFWSHLIICFAQSCSKN